MKLIQRVLTPLLLLVIPFFAALFSEEFNWSLSDFILMGVLLAFVGFGAHLILERFENRRIRLILISIVILFFILIWIELAVGVFGSPFAGS